MSHVFIVFLHVMKIFGVSKIYRNITMLNDKIGVKIGTYPRFMKQVTHIAICSRRVRAMGMVEINW